MSTSTTIALPDYSELSVEENIKRATGLVSALTLAEKMTSERTWEIAALAAAATPTTGTMAPGKSAESAFLTSEDYAEESGWIASGRSVATLRKLVACYRKWEAVGRIEGCGFWTHYEYRNKTEELLPNTSYNEAKAARSPEAAQSLVQGTLATVSIADAVHAAAEFVDTDNAADALASDEEAEDHLWSAVTRSTKKRGKSKPREEQQTLKGVEVILTLIGVLGDIREMYRADPESPVIPAAKDLMRETLQILDGEADVVDVSDEAVAEMISGLERLLASE